MSQPAKRYISLSKEPLLPYQDRQTALLPGEVWRDVPGYEGYYQVSNLGRVKSLDRVIPHPRLGKQTVYGRLLTQKVVININTIREEKMVDLQVSLSMEGKQHYRNVRRLVYAAFVEKMSGKGNALLRHPPLRTARGGGPPPSFPASISSK
jgi:hypothetical protein